MAGAGKGADGFFRAAQTDEGKARTKPKEQMIKQKHSITAEELGITIETGTLARQANGAVTVRLGETMVFAAATAAKDISPGQDYFPLMVDYREKFSAAGRFPGGFFKREGRPSEREVLTSRLCDRPLRPLFPKGFFNEVQVLGMLMTADLENDSDILMVNAASAALTVSDIPWNGPVGCVRVGQAEGQFIVNPTHAQMFESGLDLIYVGNEKEMMMIEGSAEEVPEERFLEALEFAQQQIQPLIAAQKELAARCGKPKKDFSLYLVAPEVEQFIRELAGERLVEAVFIEQKHEREEAIAALRQEAEQKLKEKMGEEAFDPNQVLWAFEELQEDVFRKNVLANQKRPDGRGLEDLREITVRTGVLPRVHGSALFQRGETQSIVTATLGTTSDNQEMDGLTGGPRAKSFLLHYNFPPYSVGECRRIMGPGRREIGHGALAERSLLPVIPTEEDFPYTIRLVSEILESNGSSSMASVCGGCMALMDAGVPVSGMVAGISCGLVTQMDDSGSIGQHLVLTDILGMEDHFGDMDFKICGTRKGITGFQLDLKIKGLPFGIAKEAVKRNAEVRLKILDMMKSELAEPRPDLNPYAPRIHQLQIDPEKIGALIGPGGKNIRRITDVSGAQIEINEDNSGSILIYATSQESMQRAVEEIEMAAADIEVGKTYRGTVRSVKDFGCFVECLPGKEGLVHVSELADFRINRVEDVCQLGDVMWVKCVGIDEKGRVRLSRSQALAEREEGDREDGLSAKMEEVRNTQKDRPPPRSGDGGRSREGARPRGGDRGPRRSRRDSSGAGERGSHRPPPRGRRRED